MADCFLHEISSQALFLSGRKGVALFSYHGETFRTAAVNHTCTPEIHICQQSMDRRARPASFIRGIATVVNGSCRQHCFHLVDERIHNHLSRRSLVTCHKCFSIGTDRVTHKGNVAERTYEIEVIECTKADHFGLQRLPFDIGKRGVSALVDHLLTVLENLVTVVDAFVKRCPVIQVFRRLQHRLLHISVVGFTHVAELHVVRAELTPSQDLTGALRHLVISRGTHIVDVVAGIPKFFFRNRGCGVKRQVILTRSHTPTQNDYGAGYQQLFEYFTVHDVLELWRWKTTSFCYAKYV